MAVETAGARHPADTRPPCIDGVEASQRHKLGFDGNNYRRERVRIVIGKDTLPLTSFHARTVWKYSIVNGDQ